MADGVNIPGWATKLGGGTVTLLVPWLIYITLGVESIKTNWESQRDTNSRVLSNLETLANYSARIVTLERQVERLETQHFCYEVYDEKPAESYATSHP
jgi:cell division protein FtsB